MHECRIAVYKAMYCFGGFMPDVMAAIDQLFFSFFLRLLMGKFETDSKNMGELCCVGR